jgi:hypothetical protein
VVDLVVDAAREKESVAVWEAHRVKLVKCPIQECVNGSAHVHL